MPDYLDTILSKSFRVIPGEEYNAYRDQVTDGGLSPKLFFEFSLMEERPWLHLRNRVYPLFVRYLSAKRMDPLTAKGVFVAVFRDDSCYLLIGPAFLQVFEEVENIDTSTLHAHIRKWLAY